MYTTCKNYGRLIFADVRPLTVACVLCKWYPCSCPTIVKCPSHLCWIIEDSASGEMFEQGNEYEGSKNLKTTVVVEGSSNLLILLNL